MPRNTTGGSGHKARANRQSNTSKKNNDLISDFLDDVKTEGMCEGVHVARVLGKCGDGRMSVFYVSGTSGTTAIAPIKGSLRGKGKKDAFVDVGTIVLLAETGLTGAMAHEIIAVLSDSHVSTLNRLAPLDARILARDVTDASALTRGPLSDEVGFEFDAGEDAKPEDEEEMDDDAIDRI